MPSRSLNYRRRALAALGMPLEKRMLHLHFLLIAPASKAGAGAGGAGSSPEAGAAARAFLAPLSLRGAPGRGERAPRRNRSEG